LCLFSFRLYRGFPPKFFFVTFVGRAAGDFSVLIFFSFDQLQAFPFPGEFPSVMRAFYLSFFFLIWSVFFSLGGIVLISGGCG